MSLITTSLLLLTVLHVPFMQGQQEYLPHNLVCSTLVSPGAEKVSLTYMELHWSKETHILTFSGLQTQPDHTGAAHRWPQIVLWRLTMLGQHWLRDSCTMLQLRNTDLPRLSSFLYMCIYIYMYVHIYIFITTVPRSLGLKTVGEVLPPKAYRPRIK